MRVQITFCNYFRYLKCFGLAYIMQKYESSNYARVSNDFRGRRFTPMRQAQLVGIRLLLEDKQKWQIILKSCGIEATEICA